MAATKVHILTLRPSIVGAAVFVLAKNVDETLKEREKFSKRTIINLNQKSSPKNYIEDCDWG